MSIWQGVVIGLSMVAGGLGLGLIIKFMWPRDLGGPRSSGKYPYLTAEEEAAVYREKQALRQKDQDAL